MSITAITARKDNKDDSSNERAALKRAVAEAVRTRADADRLHNAVESAMNLAMENRRRVESASRAVATARDQDAQQLAAAIASGTSVSPQATRRAREQEIEASDALEATRAATTRLEADLKHAEHEAEHADRAVIAAVAVVLAPVAKRMAEEARHYRSAFLARMHAIDAMCVSGLDGIARLRFDVSDEEHRALCGSVRQPWIDAIEALKSGDVSAGLPDLAGD